MKTLLAGALLALSLGAPTSGLAAAPEKFEKDCVKARSKALRDRPREEHQYFCRCVTEGSLRLGLSNRDFAIERSRMGDDSEIFASGRIRQVSARCDEDLSRPRQARARR